MVMISTSMATVTSISTRVTPRRRRWTDRNGVRMFRFTVEAPCTGKRDKASYRVKMVVGITLTTDGQIRAALITAGVPTAVSAVRDSRFWLT